MIALAAGLVSQRASALDPSRTIRQFDHTSWSVRQGAPSGIVAMAQTTDGFLWLGSSSGIVRFDGVTFEAFRPTTGPAFPQSDITALAATKDGGLWIGYRLGGCSFLKDGVLTNYLFPEGTVWDFKVGNDGTVWMSGFFPGGFARLVGREWDETGHRLGSTQSNVSNLYFDHRGDLWIKPMSGHISVLRSGANRIQDTNLDADNGAPLVELRDGSILWLDKSGLARLLDTAHPLSKLIDHPVSIHQPSSALLIDRDGVLWAFSHDEVLRVQEPFFFPDYTSQHKHALQKSAATESLGYVSAAIEDREGNIWVATPNGLDRFRMTTFQPALLGRNAALLGFGIVAGRNGDVLAGTGDNTLLVLHNNDAKPIVSIRTNDVDCLYQSPDGKLWIGGTGKLGYLQGGSYRSVLLPGKQNRLAVQSLSYDKVGGLWMSQVKQPIFVLKNNHWTEVRPPEGFPRTAVILATDREGGVWAGYMGGKIASFKNGIVTGYSARDGLSVGNVMSIYETASDIWVAGQHGINVYREGRFIPLRFADKLEATGVTGLVAGADGSLWMNTISGIVGISANEIHEFLKSSEHLVSYTQYDVLDGVVGTPEQLRPLPSAIRATDGRLWFALFGDVVSVDPQNVFRDLTQPAVTILRVKDGLGQEQIGSIVTLAKTARDIEIDYTAGSLSIPERVHFRYRMDGGGWQDAGTRRQAFFTGVSAGEHSFQVIASNGYGVWNETGSTITLFRPPTFEESAVFKLLWALFGSLIVYALYFIRMRQITSKVQLRMSERLVERERIARELHDTLLQGFQSVLLRFQTIGKRLADDARVHNEMEDTISRANRVLTEARDKVWLLRAATRPAGDLASYLSKSASDLSSQWGAHFSLHIIGTPRTLLVDSFEEICAITLEALSNAFRHSGAEAIDVELRFGQSELCTRVSDNGTGLPIDAGERHKNTKHWGLLGMQERAKRLGATLVMRRQQKGGTEVQLTVPASVCYGAARFSWKRHFKGGSA